jgi:TRAP-type mannitol/chloroaromatic compound transport system substrate-binding protein
MGFHKIAPYYYTGWHEPGSELQFLVNKRVWEKLPEDLQEILRVAMRTAAYDMYTQATHESGKNWSTMKAEYPDVKVRDFPPEVMAAMKDANNRLLAKHAEENELAKEIQMSQATYLQQVRSWTDISHRAYLNSQAD